MSEHPKNCWCFMCRPENEPRQPLAVSKSELAAPHGSHLTVEQILNDLEAGRRVSADEKLEAAKFLLSEVMQWHSNTDSNDYNECDKDPCHWCANARLIVGANVQGLRQRPAGEAAD